MKTRAVRYTLATLLASLLAACGGGDGTPAAVPVGDTVVITESGQVASFNRATPGTVVGSRAITDVVIGESLVGIDVRPANGLLYALGDRGNLYTLDAATGRATFRAALKAAAGDDLPYAVLTGLQFGVDFNPVADRLRVVSTSGQNLRINVDTGDTITDGTLKFGGEAANGVVPSVTAAAYTNSQRGSTATELYVLDLAQGTLFLQAPPNDGTLVTRASLNLAGGGLNGFDIEARGGSGYAAVRNTNAAALYRIALSGSGNAASLVGEIGVAGNITGLALVQPD